METHLESWTCLPATMVVLPSVNLHLCVQIDTPTDTPARDRFARYRGLKSWRSSPWDAREGLPQDYANTFAFENFKRAHKRCAAANQASVIHCHSPFAVCYWFSNGHNEHLVQFSLCIVSALYQKHAFSRWQLGQVRPMALAKMPPAAAALAASGYMHVLLSIRNINCPILCGAHVHV